MPSIREICESLEHVPGALRGEPEPQSRRSGDLPAAPFYDPDRTAAGELSSKAYAEAGDDPDDREDTLDEL